MQTIELVIGYFLALEILCLEQEMFGRACHLMTCFILIIMIGAIFFPRKTIVKK